MDYTVKAFMKQHTLLHKGATVLVGVSGGPDSMALLHMYTRLRNKWNLRVIALAVDHQLRGDESAADIQFVKEECARLDIPFVETEVEVAAYKKAEKTSTQFASRTLRYRFFEKQMQIHQADYLALGHHGDDQTETMAMGLVHQTNPRTLAGIPVKRAFASGQIVRPFLCCTKEMIYDYCATHAVPFRIDPSNEDDAYERNYFRKHIMPLFVQQNPNVQHTMQHLSERLSEDEQFMEREAQKVIEKVVSLKKNEGIAEFHLKDFLPLPIALQRRSFHLLLNYLYEENIDGVTYAHERSFFALCNNQKPHARVDLPNNGKIEKVYDTIYLYIDHRNLGEPYVYELPVPGEITLPQGDIISVSITEGTQVSGKHTHVCHMQHTQLPLYVRTRRDGDRMSWSGLKGTKKIKDLFIDEKIPRKDRATWPVVTDKQDRILWVVGIRKSDILNLNHSEQSTYITIHYRTAENAGGE